MRWMFDALGFAPQITMHPACTKSWNATPGILPYIPMATFVVGVAQRVRARRDAPRRAK